MTVYDNDSAVSVKLWDEKANLPGIEELKPGDLIKIIKAYIKSDLNGSPTINVGSDLISSRPIKKVKLLQLMN